MKIEHNHPQDILFHGDCRRCRLNAAAPELLAALERVANCADTAAHLLRTVAPEESKFFKKDAAFARAAIAKATEK